MTFLLFNQGAAQPDEQPTMVVSLLSGKKEEGANPFHSTVSEYLPEFVNDDHSKFVSFIEAYYEWSNQKENPHGTSSTLMDTLDIDLTLDSFIEYFKDNYLHEFPKVFAKLSSGEETNKKTILKNVTDFYSSKGSEKSYQFLFRILYDSDIDFYYPKKDIMRLSDGKWVEKKSIKITSNNGTQNFSMKNKSVQQIDSVLGGSVTAYANVESVYQYQLNQYTVTELFLTDINGTFTQGSDVISILDDGTKLRERIYSIPSAVEIHDGGVGYRSGDEINIDETSDSYFSGVGAKGSVSEVQTSTGKVKSGRIDNFGVDYKTSSTTITKLPINFRSSSGQGASGSVNLNALCLYPGYYANNDGHLSSNKRIRDNNLYQEYSYVLKSEVSLADYKSRIKKLVHPAGNKLFGNISIFNSATSSIPYSSIIKQSKIPVIGRYTAYTLDTQDNLRGTTGAGGGAVDLYPRGFQPGSTGANHCLGNTGGRLAIKTGTATFGGGYTLGSFRNGESISGSTSGVTGTIFAWSRNSATGGTMFIYTHGGGTALGFTTGEEIIGTGGATAIIEHVTMGNGTVYEFASHTHITGPNGGLTQGATSFGATAYWDIEQSPISDAGFDTSISVQTFSETQTGYTAGYDFNIGNVVTQMDNETGNTRRGIVKDWIPGISGGTGNTLKIQSLSGVDFENGTIQEINNIDGSVSVTYIGTGGMSTETIRQKVKHLDFQSVVKLDASWQFHSDHGYTV